MINPLTGYLIPNNLVNSVSIVSGGIFNKCKCLFGVLFKIDVVYEKTRKIQENGIFTDDIYKKLQDDSIQ
jgi:hypothetical protein